MSQYKNTKVDYISDITRFLNDFDKKPEAHSTARKEEELKYKRIHHLRDNTEENQKDSKLWKGF